MDVSSLKRNSSLSEVGDWVDDIPGLDDVRLRVRGLTSPTVVSYRARRERRAPPSDRDRDGTLKPGPAMEALADALVEVVLLDWDGFTSNGEPVPYSKEQASEWLHDPDFMAFADAVTWAAQVVGRDNKEKEEALGKN